MTQYHKHRLHADTESAEPQLSIQEAATIGDIDLVRSLIEKGTEVDSREDHSLRTALHCAAMNGHKSVAELLLASGANTDTRDVWPRVTPLHYAAEGGYTEIVEFLIVKGADVDARRKYPAGDTPLEIARAMDYGDLAELLTKHGAKE